MILGEGGGEGRGGGEARVKLTAAAVEIAVNRPSLDRCRRIVTGTLVSRGRRSLESRVRMSDCIDGGRWDEEAGGLSRIDLSWGMQPAFGGCSPRDRHLLSLTC